MNPYDRDESQKAAQRATRQGPEEAGRTAEDRAQAGAGAGADADATARAAAETPAGPRLSATDVQRIEQDVADALQTVYDPEIPVNIYELGLIYKIDVGADGKVEIRMTLTSPACPVAGSLPGEVEAKAAAVEGVAEARVELVWDPPWSQDRMSEAAKLQLGFF